MMHTPKKPFFAGLVSLLLAATSLNALTEDEKKYLETFGWFTAHRTQITALGMNDEELKHFFKGVENAMQGGVPQDSPSQQDIGNYLRGKAEAYQATFQQDIYPAFEKYMTELEQAEQKRAEAEGKANTEKGKAFLTDLDGKDGITKTTSGLYYEIIKEGNGVKPTAADRVKVHYHGTLINGTVFDSSVNRGEPATFGLGQVIPGWTEGLQYVSEGGKIKLYIPSELAYKDRATGNIPPNSTLIFEVELLEVQKAKPKHTATTPPLGIEDAKKSEE